MLRTFFIKSNKVVCRMQYSSRGKKEFKFLSTPVKTCTDESKLPPPTKIDQATIELLEKLSLVNFENEAAIKIVEDAIRFADQIIEVDTKDVKPMVTVLEDECLYLRKDEVKQDVTTKELLSNCKVSQENYFVTPLGNQEYKSEKNQMENNISSQSLPKKGKICKN